MTSEAITKNDLKAILNEVLPPTPSEYKKLLWQNPNSTAAFAAQTVSLDLSDYDEVEIVYNENSLDPITNPSVTLEKSRSTNIILFHSLSTTGTNNNIGTRSVSWSDNGVIFGAYSYKNYTNGTSLTTANEYCVPQKIYGIKYERVAPPQINASDYVIEQGNSSNWYYRKWNSGKAELWGRFTQTQSAYTTSGFIIGSSSITAFPFAISNPISQATLIKVNTGGGYISFDYSRTDYWSGIATSGISITTGTSATIEWTVYTIANWK